ncbi:MAG: hypothetical protein AAGU14_04440 [Eubacteriaceae bacterium]
MDYFINYQMGLFGTFSNIKPSPENVSKLMTNLNNSNNDIKIRFIPSIIKAFNINIDESEFIYDDRIQMITEDKVWSIDFLPNRIDINYSYKENNDKFYLLQDLNDISKEISKIIESVIEKKFYRLAINCKMYIENMNNQDIQSYIRKLIIPLKYYQEKEIINFNMNLQSKCELKINDIEEKINTITKLSTDKIKIKDESIKLIAIFDINTSKDETKERFSTDNLNLFCDEVKKIINNLVEDIRSIEV